MSGGPHAPVPAAAPAPTPAPAPAAATASASTPSPAAAAPPLPPLPPGSPTGVAHRGSRRLSGGSSTGTGTGTTRVHVQLPPNSITIGSGSGGGGGGGSGPASPLAAVAAHAIRLDLSTVKPPRSVRGATVPSFSFDSAKGSSGFYPDHDGGGGGSGGRGSGGGGGGGGRVAAGTITTPPTAYSTGRSDTAAAVAPMAPAYPMDDFDDDEGGGGGGEEEVPDFSYEPMPTARGGDDIDDSIEESFAKAELYAAAQRSHAVAALSARLPHDTPAGGVVLSTSRSSSVTGGGGLRHTARSSGSSPMGEILLGAGGGAGSSTGAGSSSSGPAGSATAGATTPAPVGFGRGGLSLPLPLRGLVTHLPLNIAPVERERGGDDRGRPALYDDYEDSSDDEDEFAREGGGGGGGGDGDGDSCGEGGSAGSGGGSGSDGGGDGGMYGSPGSSPDRRVHSGRSGGGGGGSDARGDATTPPPGVRRAESSRGSGSGRGRGGPIESRAAQLAMYERVASRILPWLYLSGAGPAQDPEVIRALGIRTIVNCAADVCKNVFETRPPPPARTTHRTHGRSVAGGLSGDSGASTAPAGGDMPAPSSSDGAGSGRPPLPPSLSPPPVGTVSPAAPAGTGSSVGAQSPPITGSPLLVPRSTGRGEETDRTSSGVPTDRSLTGYNAPPFRPPPGAPWLAGGGGAVSGHGAASALALSAAAVGTGVHGWAARGSGTVAGAGVAGALPRGGSGIAMTGGSDSAASSCCAPSVSTSSYVPPITSSGARPGDGYSVAEVVTAGTAAQLPSGALAGNVPWPVSYVTLFLLDGLSQDIFSLFYRVIHAVEATRTSGGAVLLHCQQGVSRSGSFVIAYCMWAAGAPLKEVYTFVRGARPIVSPNAAFLCQLMEWESYLAVINGPRLPTVPPPALTDGSDAAATATDAPSGEVTQVQPPLPPPPTPLLYRVTRLPQLYFASGPLLQQAAVSAGHAHLLVDYRDDGGGGGGSDDDDCASDRGSTQAGGGGAGSGGSVSGAGGGGGAGGAPTAGARRLRYQLSNDSQESDRAFGIAGGKSGGSSVSGGAGIGVSGSGGAGDSIMHDPFGPSPIDISPMSRTRGGDVGGELGSAPVVGSRPSSAGTEEPAAAAQGGADWTVVESGSGGGEDTLMVSGAIAAQLHQFTSAVVSPERGHAVATGNFVFTGPEGMEVDAGAPPAGTLVVDAATQQTTAAMAALALGDGPAGDGGGDAGGGSGASGSGGGGGGGSGGGGAGTQRRQRRRTGSSSSHATWVEASLPPTVAIPPAPASVRRPGSSMSAGASGGGGGGGSLTAAVRRGSVGALSGSRQPWQYVLQLCRDEVNRNLTKPTRQALEAHPEGIYVIVIPSLSWRPARGSGHGSGHGHSHTHTHTHGHTHSHAHGHSGALVAMPSSPPGHGSHAHTHALLRHAALKLNAYLWIGSDVSLAPLMTAVSSRRASWTATWPATGVAAVAGSEPVFTFPSARFGPDGTSSGAAAVAGPPPPGSAAGGSRAVSEGTGSMFIGVLPTPAAATGPTVFAALHDDDGSAASTTAAVPIATAISARRRGHAASSPPGHSGGGSGGGGGGGGGSGSGRNEPSPTALPPRPVGTPGGKPRTRPPPVPLPPLARVPSAHTMITLPNGVRIPMPLSPAGSVSSVPLSPRERVARAAANNLPVEVSAALQFAASEMSLWQSLARPPAALRTEMARLLADQARRVAAAAAAAAAGGMAAHSSSPEHAAGGGAANNMARVHLRWRLRGMIRQGDNDGVLWHLLPDETSASGSASGSGANSSRGGGAGGGGSGSSAGSGTGGVGSVGGGGGRGAIAYRIPPLLAPLASGATVGSVPGFASPTSSGGGGSGGAGGEDKYTGTVADGALMGSSAGGPLQTIRSLEGGDDTDDDDGMTFTVPPSRAAAAAAAVSGEGEGSSGGLESGLTRGMKALALDRRLPDVALGSGALSSSSRSSTSGGGGGPPPLGGGDGEADGRSESGGGTEWEARHTVASSSPGGRAHGLRGLGGSDGALRPARVPVLRIPVRSGVPLLSPPGASGGDAAGGGGDPSAHPPLPTSSSDGSGSGTGSGVRMAVEAYVTSRVAGPLGGGGGGGIGGGGIGGGGGGGGPGEARIPPQFKVPPLAIPPKAAR